MKFLIGQSKFTFICLNISLILLSITECSKLPFYERKYDTELPKNITSRIEEPPHGYLNHSYFIKDVKTFKNENNEWDFKLLSRQLEDVFHLFLYLNNKDITPHSTRGIIKLFTDSFEKCDLNKDNVLSNEEFNSCVKSSKYFKIFNLDEIRQPQYMIKLIKENVKWTNILDTDSLVIRVFSLLDEFGNNYLNFYDYMILRLISFAWRRCNNIGFFIDEVNFECAIEIVAKKKTLNRNSAKTLYALGLELSNYQTFRHLDLATFVLLSLDCRLYSKINTKEDDELTLNELTTALEASVLPIRYDREIVKLFFSMLSYPDKKINDLDLYTFIFYDIFLRLYNIEPDGREVKGINYGEFVNVLNDFLFPKKIIEMMYYIPDIIFKEEDYKKLMQVVVPKYFEEKDFLLRKMKFREKEGMIYSDNEAQTTDNKESSSSSESASSSVHSSSSDSSSSESSSSVSSSSSETSTSKSSSRNKSKKSKSSKKNKSSKRKSSIHSSTASKYSYTDSSYVFTRKFKTLKEKISWIRKSTNIYKENSYYYIINPKKFLYFNFDHATSMIFHLMDFPQHNVINYEQFIYFIEIIYLFKKFDKDKLGKLYSHQLLDKYKRYSGYPKINEKIYKYVDKFKYLNKNIQFNPFYTYVMFRADDLVKNYVIEDYYGVLINEINMKIVFERMNLRLLPDGFLKKCIKGYEDINLNMKVPKYDWICAFNVAIENVCVHLETIISHRITKKNNIKLQNTEFKNFPEEE
jgi:hypothetical protein